MEQEQVNKYRIFRSYLGTRMGRLSALLPYELSKVVKSLKLRRVLCL